MKTNLRFTLLSFCIVFMCHYSFANHSEKNANNCATDVNDLILVGLGDGPFSGAPKFAEFYVVNDIPDLSIYGLGSANNGGGTDGQEWTFPADAATAGSTIFVVNNAVEFTNFMGFNADYEDGGASCNFNGDDAFEVFENGIVIDVFGELNLDGTGTSWEYTDGWVKRVNETGPDGTTFTESNWTYSGINVFDGQTTNASSPVPYPLTPYDPGGGSGPTVDLQLKGVIHANTSVRATEFEVLNDISDLSIYGIGCTNNGGGSDGQEWTFPAVAASAGDRIYVARNATAFADFFGFAADFEDASGDAHNFNGDDGLEIFMNGTLIEIYGDTLADGTGEAWEYTEGWAHRVDGTGPDNATFVISNWEFSGLGNYVGATSNAGATVPYPVAGGVAPTVDLQLKGVIHASTDVRATEFEVLNDIPDLSIYGIGCTNNGGGSDGQEWTFPAASAVAGDRIYVARNANAFADFFGFAADFEDAPGDALNFNGDDGLEIFMNGTLVEIYGDTLADGTGEPWEYTNGWAHRVDGTGPDNAMFVLGNWEFSALGNYVGATTNDGAPEPYPVLGGSNPVVSDLVLVGMIYASADVKSTEYYVLNDIADLSTYGVGCDNNGGGSDGEEWTFPAVSATAGDRIYVTRDLVAFQDFFGFAADFEDAAGDAHNFNGDDGFELYGLGVAVDLYGDTLLDGTGLEWEYVNTWAQRECATGPDGSTFILGNWMIAEQDNFVGTTTNADAVDPYPVDTYLPTPCGGGGGDMDIVMTEIMYNPPGTDLEYIEFYNNTPNAIDMTGYSIADAVVFTFPAVTLAAGEYILVTDDSISMESFWGVTAHQWTSGSLLNSGEEVTLLDAGGMVVDVVSFDDAAPWSVTPDGRGPSLVLCDVNTDNNDGNNWQRAISSSGNLVDGRFVFGDPGVGSTCVNEPIVAIQAAEVIVGEAGGSLTVLFYIDNPNSTATSVDLTLVGGGTADASDFTFSPATITFPADTDTFQMVVIDIIDDTMEEPEENFGIEISNPTNSALITNGTMNISIVDNDAPISNSLKIIGLVHGPNSGVPKAVELYAINDIPNLSLFGLGCANNGGGSDGQEYTFPPVSIDAGTCFFVSNDTLAFTQFFGFSADFQDDGAANNFNGDDAYELFESGTVIDVFGEIDVDGTGALWEYSLGWAHREPGTGPDGETFVLSNWTFSGIDAFLGVTTNAEAANPYEFGVCTGGVSVDNIDLSAEIQLKPNPVSDQLQVTSTIEIEKIKVYNLLGQEVLVVTNPGLDAVINVSNLLSNVYLFSFITADGVWTEKVLVSR